MNTEKYTSNQEIIPNAKKISTIPSSFLIFPSILAALSIICLIAYTVYMHYVVSVVITIYSTIALTIFILDLIALKTANAVLYKLATIVTSAFILAEPLSAALIGAFTHINSLYTYTLNHLASMLIFIAITKLFFYFREKQSNVNARLLYKVLFSCIAISMGIICGTTVLRYDSVFSVIAAIIAYISPIAVFLPIAAQRKTLFKIIKILNIVLLLGFFIFYVDMLLTFFEVIPLNIGGHSQLYKLYSILRLSDFGPEYYSWICTLFFEAFLEILYPTVLLVNIFICKNRQDQLY